MTGAGGRAASAGARPGGHHRVGLLLWGAAAAVLAVVLVKTFVADLYRVSSSSMEPTVFGGPDDGETVLVRYGRGPVERFGLVVVRRPGQDEPVVKRVVGLPGETVSLSGGDLVVDGGRLGPDVPRPPFVPVYESERTPLEEAFHFKAAPNGPWSPAETGECWRVDAREIDAGSNLGLMLYSPDVRDTYPHPSGEPRGGLHQVGDVVLELELRATGSGGRLRFLLVEEGDTFEGALEPRGDGTARAVLERWVPGAPNAELAAGALPWRPGAWHALRIANVDNHLALRVGGPDGAELASLEHTYAANEPYPGVTRGADLSVGARAGFGAAGLEATFRDVRVLRDLHYTARGTYGVETPVTLGLGELFLLGDHSADSRDGRFWGPVEVAEIVGRPVAVVLPLERRRVLETVGPPLRPR